MLEVTRNHRTDKLREVRFLGPAEKIEELAQIAESYGFEDISDLVPWRDAFPEFDDESTPSVALRGARRKESLTQKELAERTGIPQSHISEMENGKRAIGKERAKRLGGALNISYRVFL